MKILLYDVVPSMLQNSFISYSSFTHLSSVFQCFLIFFFLHKGIFFLNAEALETFDNTVL